MKGDGKRSGALKALSDRMELCIIGQVYFLSHQLTQDDATLAATDRGRRQGPSTHNRHGWPSPSATGTLKPMISLHSDIC